MIKVPSLTSFELNLKKKGVKTNNINTFFTQSTFGCLLIVSYSSLAYWYLLKLT